MGKGLSTYNPTHILIAFTVLHYSYILVLQSKFSIENSYSTYKIVFLYPIVIFRLANSPEIFGELSSTPIQKFLERTPSFLQLQRRGEFSENAPSTI